MKNIIIVLVLILSVNSLFSQEVKQGKKVEPVKTEKVSKVRNWKFQKTNDGYIIVRKDLFIKRKIVVA